MNSHSFRVAAIVARPNRMRILPGTGRLERKALQKDSKRNAMKDKLLILLALVSLGNVDLADGDFR